MNDYIKDYINTLNKSIIKKNNYITFTNTTFTNTNEKKQNISLIYGDFKLNDYNLTTKQATRCDYFNFINNKVWECYDFTNKNISINQKELIYTNTNIKYPDVLSLNNSNNNYLIIIIVLLSLILLMRTFGRLFR